MILLVGVGIGLAIGLVIAVIAVGLVMKRAGIGDTFNEFNGIRK